MGERYFSGSRSTAAVWRTLRALAALTAIRCAFQRQWAGFFSCMMTLLLFLTLPLAGRQLRVKLPAAMQITLLLFFFGACVLGETACFYLRFPFWDVLLHAVSGVLFAAFGFCLGDLLDKERRVRLSPLLCAVTAFCFSMTTGVLWEFFEYAADHLLSLDMQKDTILRGFQSVLLDPSRQNIPLPVGDIAETIIHSGDGKEYVLQGYLDVGLRDTMKDLFVNFVGAAAFSALGYISLTRQGGLRLVSALIPVAETPCGMAGMPITAARGAAFPVKPHKFLKKA